MGPVSFDSSVEITIYAIVNNEVIATLVGDEFILN